MAFPGTGTIWMNGSLVEWNDAKIHVASHVVHYGSGVFEGARCYDTPNGPACFRLDAHMRRLIDSARIYRMESQWDQATLTQAVIDHLSLIVMARLPFAVPMDPVHAARANGVEQKLQKAGSGTGIAPRRPREQENVRGDRARCARQA